MLIILGICFLTTVSSHTRCGPYGQCKCSPHTMECINTNSTLDEICKNTRREIHSLHAAGNNFGEIQPKDLEKCKTVTELRLARNNINFQENCTFCNLEKLKLLDLSENNISLDQKTVHLKQFPSFLTLLKLNGNTVTESTEYPHLAYLEQLTELHIDGLFNRSFQTSYEQMGHLKTVVLSGLSGKCNLTHLTNETVKHLVSVVFLNLSGCNILTIHAGAFEQLQKLEILDVSYNRQMGYEVFRNITYGLQFTKIKSVNVSSVKNTFADSVKLRIRDVCYLWNTSLNELVINSNRMETVETNALILLPATLKVMHAQDNVFTFGPYLLQIGCIPNLEIADLNFQKKDHDPRLFDQQPQEKTDNNESDNHDCPFATPEFLYNFSKQRKYCHYMKTGEKVFITKNYPMFPETLKRFTFVSSKMQYNVPQVLMFPLKNSLEYLDASGNIFYTWTGPVGPFPELKYLDLSKNYCSFIGLKFFDGALHVENLQLQHNFLGLIFQKEHVGSHVFDKLVKVKTLNLSSNIISNIQADTFSSMVSLETLDLRMNLMEIWNISVENLHHLLHLNLQSNFFQSLPNKLTSKLEDNAKRLNRTFSIDFSKNNIKINCENSAFLIWMVNQRKHFSSFTEYNFHDSSGSRLSAVLFIKAVENLNKTCKSYTLEIVAGSIGVSIFLAVTVVGLLYRNRWNLKYLLRMTKIRHFGYRRLQEFLGREFEYDAFISYANENHEFVLKELIPQLEYHDFKLYFHDRNFLPGSPIADNILAAITKSRKTIVILSEDFLTSEWCLYEFNMARMESIYSRGDSECLLVVLLEDVSLTNMSTEMLHWIRRNTYLEYTTDEQGQLVFWDRLLKAL